jgi:mRNA interferase HigB
MRVVKPSRIADFRAYPKARWGLSRWLELVEAHVWGSLQEMRRVFPTADGVVVESGRVVTVFNIGGNDYRLVTAIHYNTGIVYVMLFMTHAEYDKNAWKEQL